MGELPAGVFRVCGKFRLQKKIGSGSFGKLKWFLYGLTGSYMVASIGDVYCGTNVLTGEDIAVKMESMNAA